MSDLTTAGNPLANVAPLDSAGMISADEIGMRNMAPSLAILLNPSLYERAKAIAVLMSRAQGVTPNWLIGKGEACFSVITMALDWKLSWHFVARHTYQTPGGAIGFDGALVQSILESSGRYIGAPGFEYRGDWRTIAGKFRMQPSQRGTGSYPVATWTDEDAVGLGVIVRWQVKGEPAPRVWPGDDDPFWLVQCQPRNSPLWATDPKTQIRYLAIRRFANMTSPGILGSASFDREEIMDAADMARDITPPREPRREDYTAGFSAATVVHEAEEEQPGFEVVALDGEVFGFETLDGALPALRTVLESARRGGARMLDAAIENNQTLIVLLTENGTDLIEEFRPTTSPRASSDGRTEAPAPVRTPAQQPRPAASPPAQPASAPQSTASPPAPQSAPAPAAPPSAPPPGAAAATNERGDVFPGDLPSGQRLAPDPTSPAAARPATPQSSPPAGTPASGSIPPSASGPTATTAASRSEPAGDRPNMAVPPPLARGRPDYRTWARALMVPKVRQQTNDIDLAYLLGDNEENLRQAHAAAPGDMPELDAAIDEAWKRLRPAP